MDAAKGKKFDSPMKGGGIDKSEEKFLRSLLEEEKKDYGGVDLTKKLYDSIP
jgi:type III secretory pathway component EscV